MTVLTAPRSSPAPVAARRPASARHHGDDVRRPLRVAPRQGRRRGHRAPRGRERLHRRRAPRTSRRCATRIFDEIKGRTLETDLSVPVAPRRLVVLRPHRRGPAVRHPVPRPARLPRRLDAARARRPTPTSRASRCCSTATSRPRATSSSRSAASRSPTTARACSTASTSPATSATRCACATSSTGEQLPDEIPGTFAGAHVLARRPLHRLHDRRRRLAPRHRVAARARHRRSTPT